MLTVQCRNSSVISAWHSHSLQSSVVVFVTNVQGLTTNCWLCSVSTAGEQREKLADLSVVILPVVIAVGDSFCSAQAV